MNDVLTELHQDHVNVTLLLDEILRQVDRIRGCETADFERLIDIMRYMTEYADGVHHPKEDILFARLSEKDHAADATIAELHEEHERLATAGLYAYQLLQAVESDAMLPRGAIIAALESYARLLRSHMDKEESRIFPLARAMLSPADWRQAASQLQFRRDPLFDKVEGRYRALSAFISADQ